MIWDEYQNHKYRKEEIQKIMKLFLKVIEEEQDEEDKKDQDKDKEKEKEHTSSLHQSLVTHIKNIQELVEGKQEAIKYVIDFQNAEEKALHSLSKRRASTIPIQGLDLSKLDAATSVYPFEGGVRKDGELCFQIGETLYISKSHGRGNNSNQQQQQQQQPSSSSSTNPDWWYAYKKSPNNTEWLEGWIPSNYVALIQKPDAV